MCLKNIYQNKFICHINNVIPFNESLCTHPLLACINLKKKNRDPTLIHNIKKCHLLCT